MLKASLRIGGERRLFRLSPERTVRAFSAFAESAEDGGKRAAQLLAGIFGAENAGQLAEEFGSSPEAAEKLVKALGKALKKAARLLFRQQKKRARRYR